MHSQLLDEDNVTFYDNDVATITVNTTSFSSINTFTVGTGSITSVVRSATTVDQDTLITISVQLATKYEDGAIFKLGLPIDEF